MEWLFNLPNLRNEFKKAVKNWLARNPQNAADYLLKVPKDYIGGE